MTTQEPMKLKHKEAPKIAIAICTGDLVFADTMMCLAQLAHACRWPKALINARATLIQVGRRNAVRQAIEYGCDFLFFVDGDMKFPPDIIERLVMFMWDHEDEGFGAVAPTYSKRIEPFHLVSKDMDHAWSILAPEQRDWREASVLPLGLMLVDMRVFAKLAEPWFEVEWSPADNEFMGEDVGFSRALRNNGFRLAIHEGLSHEVGHIGYHAFSTADVWDRVKHDLAGSELRRLNDVVA